MKFGRKGEPAARAGSYSPRLELLLHQDPPCRAAALLQCTERVSPASSPLLCSPSTICCFKLENIAGEVSKNAIFMAWGLLHLG